MYDAYSTADLLLADWREGVSVRVGASSPSYPSSSFSSSPSSSASSTDSALEPLPDIPPALRQSTSRIVSYEDWLRVDAEEVRRGKALGKLREKILSVEEMLRVVG